MTEGSAVAARSASSRALVAGALAIVALVLLVYLSALDAPFTFDDENNITLNPGIRSGSLRLLGPTPRPVANGSFALCHAWFGLDVRGYRAVNVGIHALASLGVMMLGVQWSRAFDARGRLSAAGHAGVGVFAGLLFAAHPLATQSVTYVVQRMTSLSTLFYVGALWLWIASAGWSARGRSWGRIGSVVVWLLGMGTKEIAATWPVVVWLWEWGYGSGRGHGAAFVRRTGWMWAVVLVGAGLALWGYGGGDPFGEYARKPFTLWERLWTEPRVWWRYVGLWLWPSPERLSVIHGVELSRGALAPWTTGLSLGSWWVAAVVGAWAWRGESRRWIGFGIAWYLVQQVVEGTVLPLEPMYEHRTYLPSVGLSIGLTYGAAQLAQRAGARTRAASLAAGAGVIAALAFAAHARNQVWRDNVLLWQSAVEHAPDRAIAHANLGVALLAAGRNAEARSAFERALALEPDHATSLQNLGALDLIDRDIDGAEKHFRAAVASDPRDALSIAGLGAVAMERGRSDEAIALHQRSLAMRSDPRVHRNLGQIHLALGRAEEARDELRTAVALDPALPIAWRRLAEAERLAGDFDASARALATAFVAEPTLALDVPGIATLTTALVREGRLARASELLERASEAAQRVARSDLAARYAELAARARASESGAPQVQMGGTPGADE